MLGSTPITAVLGSGVDGTNHEAVKSFIRTACGEGLALLLIVPGTKQPFDGRTARKKNADDKAAQLAAKEAGRRDWAKVKSPSGLALATADSKVVLRYLDEYLKVFGPECSVNLAVEVGRSHLVLIDADTRAQYDAFIEVSGAPQDMPPTVITPGQRDVRTGEMVHDGAGGHFWFTLDEGVELPTNLGSMTWEGDDSFAVLWHNRYVLIPPSVRPEGAYELVGRDYPCPEWLLAAIRERAESRARRVSNAGDKADASDLSTDIDAWAETITWAEILEPLGWTPTSRSDNCGCDVWTAPGPHTSNKSATTHDSGCMLGRYTETNAPMHIWTDNPGEPFDAYIAENHTKTLSKLQAVAWSEYGGDIGATMDTLGLGGEVYTIEAESGVSKANIAEDIELSKDDLPPIEQVAPAMGEKFDNTTLYGEDAPPFDISGQTPPNASSTRVETDQTGDFPGEEQDQRPDVFESDIAGVPIMAPWTYWMHLPPPEYVVEGLVESGATTLVIGPPGIGKSTVALDLACHMAIGKSWHGRKTLKTKVLYLPGEGQRGAIQRIKAWAQAHDIPPELLAEGLLVGDSVIRLNASKEAWGELAQYVIRRNIGMIIYDTFARMALGLEENSATDVGRAVERFDQIRKLTNAGAMIVHHTGKATPTVARGSGALTAAVETELLVTEARWTYEETAPGLLDENSRPPAGKPIGVETTKQKNAEQVEGQIPLLLTNWEPVDAALITGINGEVDPMLGDVVLARPVEETTLETAIRIRAFLETLTEQGATRADIIALVRPDPYTVNRKDAAKAWKQKVMVAIDRGIHFDLIETASGQRLGARYVPGLGTPEQARVAHAAEVITDSD